VIFGTTGRVSEIVRKNPERGDQRLATGLYDEPDQINACTTEHDHGEDVADATAIRPGSAQVRDAKYLSDWQPREDPQFLCKMSTPLLRMPGCKKRWLRWPANNENHWSSLAAC